MILQLAVMGKLVPQDPAAEPASVLLKPIKPSDQPFKIPPNWIFCQFRELVDSLLSGGTPSKANPTFWNGNIPWASVKDLGKSKIITSTQDYITQEGLKSGSKLAKKGDVLICTRMGLGKIAIAGIDVAINQDLKAIRLNYLVDINYFLNTFATLKIKGTGTTVAGIKQEELLNFPIPLPPLAEQKRIVAKVDSLMALCDKLETLQQQRQQLDPITQTALLDALLTPNTGVSSAWQRLNQHMTTLFHTPESVKALRETILQLAVMGKLVPQDPNDEPAAVLLQHIAAEKDRLIQEGKIKRQKPLPAIRDDEKPFELPTGWEWVRLASIAELITSGSRDWAQYYSNSGAIFIRMGNLSRGHYEMRLSHIQYISPPNDGEGSRTKLEESDLLISITGDVGMLGLVPPNFGEAYINQHTCLVRFMSTCRNRYFPELLRSPLAMDQFNAPQRGIKNSFRLGDVGEMLIPLPPLAEQQRIVAKVDSLMALCDKLETRLQAARETAGLFASEAVNGGILPTIG